MEPTRPRLHFTPRSGGLGDLFGVLASGGRYHVFYRRQPDDRQPNDRQPGDPQPGDRRPESRQPEGRQPDMVGHATSDDLVFWTEQQVSDAPRDPGCGTVVAGPDAPVLFFTRTDGEVARAVAAPGLAGWCTDPAAPVIAAPPDGISGLRDPYVWPEAGGWRMLLGARLSSGAGAIVQYSSGDQLTWDYDGVLVHGDQPGSGWGCPRLFALDGAWVLLLDKGTAGGDLAYAIGSYDGRAFTARVWDVFGRGRLGPAITFIDAAGRRCALARLGEQAAPPGSPWAGALSLPWILSVRGERLLATPHPHLDRYLISGASGLTAAGGELRDHGELILRMPPGGETTVLADADIVEVSVEGVSGFAAARRSGPGAAGARIARFAGSPLRPV